MKAAVKFAEGTDDVLDILAIPFGGPLKGKDTDGEFFSPNTDLCLEWFPTDRPLLYHHGVDAGLGVTVVGRVDSTTAKMVDEQGWWIQAQLDKSNAYFEAISKLVGDGKLFGSSGAMPHLTKRARTGEILRWPWVEQSLTPTPANLFSAVQPAEAEKHYKAAGLDFSVKTLPTEPTQVDGVDGDPPEGSYEDLIADLRRLLQLAFAPNMALDPYASYPYVMVLATFPEYCVACICEAQGNRYFEVAYSLPNGPLQDPELGEMREVERTYTPKAVTLARLERSVAAYERLIAQMDAATAGAT